MPDPQQRHRRQYTGINTGLDQGRLDPQLLFYTQRTRPTTRDGAAILARVV
jgi:hypothetical protein